MALLIKHMSCKCQDQDTYSPHSPKNLDRYSVLLLSQSCVDRDEQSLWCSGKPERVRFMLIEIHVIEMK